MRLYLASAAAALLSVGLCVDCFVHAEPATPPPGTFAFNCCGGQGASNDECCGCVAFAGGFVQQSSSNSYNACGAAPSVEHWCRTVIVDCFNVNNVQRFTAKAGTGCPSTCNTPFGLVSGVKQITSCDQYYGGCD
ncbi:hypothetical protein R5W23_005321 [Gemmata sp. JC673]|uniref:Uncharacterized protein n=1 Tax=Gemmata algarum TaxID=2975278 RepID=A0ABU5F8X7_9BACT|nr:hypothetical protein [Gemmata algarum]MDY3563705.1 hypothetical protein [Gemmata algarum]